MIGDSKVHEETDLSADPQENPSNHVFARNAEAPDLCMIQKPLKSYVWTAA